MKLTLVKIISLFFVMLLAQSLSAYTPTVGAIHGHIYTRGVVLDKNGNATYVAYHEDSTTKPDFIHSVTGEYKDAQVMATIQAKAVVDLYDALSQDYPDAELLTRQEFSALPDLPPNTPAIDSQFNFVMVRGEAQRELMIDGSQLVLQSFVIDPTQEYMGKSLLISKEGKVLANSEGNIGLRTSFLQDKNNEPVYGYIEASTFSRWDAGYRPVSPLVNLPVSTGEWIIGGRKTVTNEEGRYHLQYYLFCPGFSYEWTIPIYADLKYSRFNPRGQAWRTYYLTSYKYDYCSGLSALYENSTSLLGQIAYMSISSIEATMTRSWHPNNIPIDIVVFDGAAKFTDVSISQDKTRYDSSKLPLERIALEAEDFDGDGTTDKVETGKFVTKTNEAGEEEKSFKAVAVAESDFQAIWLSTEHDLGTLDTSKTLPSYTRLLDWSDDFNDRALLSQITEKDLQNTDIYIIRESDGTLITERRGLKAKETPRVVDNLSTWDGEVKYTIQVVNQYEGRNRYGYTSRRYGRGSFKQWQIASNMNPKFYEREADHLRIGERVKIVAINRATGYLGSESVEVKAAGGDGIAQLLSFAIPKINMYPPNLKIWAKRSSEIKQGLTKSGEAKEQTIGSEGAGLSDDKSIIISTEWLDHSGGPLPAVLEDYGFTGRLAKVTAKNILSAKNGHSSSGNSLSNFAIKPGRQTQVIKLGKDTLGEEHLYVHVSGEPQKRRPDLSSGLTEAFSGNFNSDPSKYSDGEILKYRPKLFAPVKVPVFDEKSTKESIKAWKEAKKENESLKKPDPIYHWLYRPEFQVSIYDLEVDKINRTQGDDTIVDVYANATPVIGSTDSIVEFLYDLTESTAPALDAYSYGNSDSEKEVDKTRELVFGIGEQEIRATVGNDQSVTFDNLGYLADLEPEDFLSIKLYSNNDSNNILWEWAFEYLAVDTLQDIEEQIDDEGVIHVSADNPILDLQALLFGYADRDPSKKKEITLTWDLKGDGTITNPHQTNSTDGVFNTKLIMPTRAGSQATIKAYLNGSLGGNAVFFGTVIVDPGEPANISSASEGTVGVAQSRYMSVTGTVTDKYGNAVSDGTPIRISVGGEALQGKGTELSITNGQFKTEITGGEFAGDGNTLEIEVNGIIDSKSFDVKPHQLSITTSEKHYLSDTDTVTIQVLDDLGSPVVGADVELGSDAGLLKDDFLITNAQGIVEANIKNVPYLKTGKISARVGFAGFIEQPYIVTNRQGDAPPSIDSKKALLVGDQSSNGTFAHERYDGVNIDMSYKIDATVDINGASLASKTVTLGNLSHPNLMPVLNYSMTRLSEDDQGTPKAPDENGLSHADIQSIEVVEDHPMGAGHSYQFKGAEVLTIANGSSPTASELKPYSDSNNVSMVFDVQFETVDAEQTLINFGEQGGQQVILNPNNTITYIVTTAKGSYQVSSEAITPSEPHNIITKFNNNEISLTIDTTAKVTAPAESFLIYRYPDRLSFTDSPDISLTEVQLRKKGSHLVNNDIDVLKLATNTGFRLDVKLDKSSTNGQLLHFNSDAVNLTLNSSNQVTYAITTDQGTYSLTSAPLTIDNWTTVAGKYHNGELTLKVNGIAQQTPASGSIQYDDIDQLKIGHHFDGKMTSLKVFDWSLQPLVEFADGSQQQTVSLDGFGHQQITVKSTGKLNSFANTELTMLSIAIVDESSQQKKDQGFINLVSTPLYKQLAGQYVEFIADDAPPIDTAYFNNPYQKTSFAKNMGKNMVNAVISPAYAFSFMDVGSKLWEVINWIVPFEDVGILGQQIYYLATGDDRFDPVELALSTLGTLSIIPLPPTKALKVVVKTLRKGLGFMKKTNPKFLKAFASVIGRIGQRAFKPVGKYIKANMSIRGLWRLKKNGIDGILSRINIDPFIEAAPFIIIVGEMLATSEGREALVTLIKSVKSDDDLFAWINYLRLPTDGWVGTTVPPIDFASLTPPLEENLPWYQEIAKKTLEYSVSDVQAAPKIRIIPAKKVRKLLIAVKDMNPKKLTSSVDAITKTMAKLGDKGLARGLLKVARKLTHTKILLKATAKLGQKGLRRLLRKGKSMRTNPILLIAAIAYLDDRHECPTNDSESKCVRHSKSIRDGKKFNAQLIKIMTGGFFDGNTYAITAREEGEMFHLVVWAYMHLMHEISDGALPQVIDIERDMKPKAPSCTNCYHRFDIALDDGDGAYIGVELKSWQKATLKLRTKQWNSGAKKGSGAHKQFFLDRVGLENFDIIVSRNDPNERKLSKIQWWLQYFKFGNGKNSPLQVDLKKRVGDRLAVLPSPPSTAKKSLNGKNGNATAPQLLREGKKLAYKEINMFTAVNLFKTNASDFITGAATEALEAYEAK